MIRLANEKDIHSIFLLQRNAFSTEWWEESEIAQDFLDSNKLYYVIEEKEQVIGFVSFLKAVDVADLLQIVVSPSCQGQGYGTKLLSYALTELKKQGIQKVYLEVRASNLARSFYENNGFIYLSTRKHYYGNEDGIVYVKE